MVRVTSGRRLIVVAMAAAAALVMAGCSSDQAIEPGGDPGWTDGDQVVTEVTEAGFDCSFEKSDELSQVITQNPWTEEDLGGTLVLCNGFQVFLVGEIDSYLDSLKSDCSAVTEEELSSDAMQRVVVVGSNFVISGTGEDQAYPEGFGPEVFASAFGATERTLGSIYEQICPELSQT
jgi:hypothetical protein